MEKKKKDLSAAVSQIPQQRWGICETAAESIPVFGYLFEITESIKPYFKASSALIK